MKTMVIKVTRILRVLKDVKLKMLKKKKSANGFIEDYVPANVVAYKKEPSNFRVSFHRSPQCIL